MGRQVQEAAFVPEDFHQEHLGARVGDEIVTGQDRKAKPCLGPDHQCLVDGLGGGAAAGQFNLENSSASASALASADSESLECPSAGHSLSTA